MNIKEPEMLFRLNELGEGESKGITLHNDGSEREIFAVRVSGKFFVYENSCPHTGATLNWLPDQFLSEDKTLIHCANHFAQFNIDDGRCVSGPCAGQSLQRVKVKVKEDAVYLADV